MPAARSAARRTDDHDVGLEQKPPEVFDDLGADGALARDDERVVIWRRRHRIALGHDFLGDGGAILGVAVVEHDLGAESPWSRFDLRRIAGITMVARMPSRPRPPPRPGRDCRRNMSRRRRRDAPTGSRKRVVGATELERSGALQRLRLQKHARVELSSSTGELIKGVRTATPSSRFAAASISAAVGCIRIDGAHKARLTPQLASATAANVTLYLNA